MLKKNRPDQLISRLNTPGERVKLSEKQLRGVLDVIEGLDYVAIGGVLPATGQSRIIEGEVRRITRDSAPSFLGPYVIRDVQKDQTVYYPNGRMVYSKVETEQGAE